MALQSGGVQRQESGLTRATRGAVELLGGRQESPSEAILDMRLPQTEAAVLGPLLSDQAFELTEDRIELRYGSVYRFTVVRDHEERGVLLHIPGWILDNPSPQKDAALTCLPFVFKGANRLFVLSRGLDAIPSPEYSEMLLADWPQYARIKVDWVPWTHIQALEKSDLPRDQLHRTLRRILDLGDPGAAPQDRVPARDLYDRAFLISLRRVLVGRFDEDGLRALCYDIGGDYESLGGGTKEGKALSLIEYVRTRRLVEDLLRVGRELRPDIPWEDIGT